MLPTLAILFKKTQQSSSEIKEEKQCYKKQTKKRKQYRLSQ